MDVLNKYKPSVSRRNLLLIAGIAWTIAGGFLAGRGLNALAGQCDHLWWRLAGGVVFGGFFYLALFSRISKMHIIRIRRLKIPYHCAFSFFNLRSYILMALMITGGIILRRFDVIGKTWLYTFYVTMGVPLLISALRFFYFWATNKEIA